MLRFAGFLMAALMAVNLWPSALMADFTLVLKNGRRITVQSYREEGGMIKFHGLGGEIGIAKEQIQAILKPGESERQGLNVQSLGAPSPESLQPTQPPAEKRPEEPKDALSPEQRLAEERAKEEKEYQKKLREVTEQLENAKQRYFSATQGGGASSSATKEGYKAWTADLMSRLKDRRGAPTSEYEAEEKELSDLRLQIDRLQKERESLIEEMKNKNFSTASF